MAVNSGLGAVIFRDSLLFDTVDITERLLAIRHANGRDWWIIIHEQLGNQFISFLLTPNGLDGPTIQAIGTSYLNSFGWGAGEMVASGSGDRIAVSIFIDSAPVDIFDFDRCSGMLSNWQSISVSGRSYGCEFSPSGQFLYISSHSPNRLRQYDLWSTNINASEYIVIQNSSQTEAFGQLEIAPNKKIYMSHISGPSVPNNNYDTINGFLSVINNPDLPGLSSNFIRQAIDVRPMRTMLQLPNLPNLNLPTLFAQTAEAGPNRLICPGDSVTLGSPDTTNGNVTYQWSPVQGLSDPNSAQPNASPSTTSWYYLAVIDPNFGPSCGTTIDSVLVTIADSSLFPVADAGPDLVTCSGNILQIGTPDPSAGAWQYQWAPSGGLSDPGTAQPIASDPGTFVLTVFNPIGTGSCFIARDTVQVDFYVPPPLPVDPAGPDRLICRGDSVQIGGTSIPNLSYQWSPADSLSNPNGPNTHLAPASSAWYSIIVIDTAFGLNCVSMDDSVFVEVEQPIVHPAPENVRFCPGEVLTIGVEPLAGFAYHWLPVTGLTDPHAAQTQIQPFESAAYVLTVTDSEKQTQNCRTREFPVTLAASNCLLQNILTPNNDGINDVLHLGDYLSPVRISIFDRWGHEVFQSDAYANDWSGTNLPDGVYFYILNITGEGGRKVVGNFTLLR